MTRPVATHLPRCLSSTTPWHWHNCDYTILAISPTQATATASPDPAPGYDADRCLVTDINHPNVCWQKYLPALTFLTMKQLPTVKLALQYCNWIVTRGVRWNIAWARGKSRGWSPMDFLRDQAIYHCIPRLSSQYSHSQSPISQYFPVLASRTTNIFQYW